MAAEPRRRARPWLGQRTWTRRGGLSGGADTWDVQISGVTGDGRDVQYRIETVYTDTADTLIFRNEDAGFMPPYFKFNSADLQAIASRITQDCPQEPVTMHGYGMRISFLDMFPNVISIDAAARCLDAPSKEGPAVTKGE